MSGAVGLLFGALVSWPSHSSLSRLIAASSLPGSVGWVGTPRDSVQVVLVALVPEVVLGHRSPFSIRSGLRQSCFAAPFRLT